MTIFETVSLYISVTGILLIVASLIFAARQIQLTRKSHADNHEWNRRIATQDVLFRLKDMDIDTLNQEFNMSSIRSPIPLAKIQEKFQDNASLQVKCHDLLNYYEAIAIGVHLGTYDDLTIKTFRKGGMERDYIKFKEYIDHRRHEISSQLFVEYERLLKSWSNELNNNVREPTGKI